MSADQAGSSSTRSERLYAEATELIPGGVNSPVRAMRSIGRDPIFVSSGEGAWIEDVDGNRYVDYVCSWGPLIAGHAPPKVVEAVCAAASRGTSFGAPTQAEVELAREVVTRIPSAQMVRMTSSGTEATMSAIRLARAATGRDRVLKFSGAYHGHVDGLLAEAGSGMATAAVPASPGITAAQAADTVIVAWNDVDAVKLAVANNAADLAAVIAEPIPANMGVVPPLDDYLELLRDLTTECGALLIFDEVITGFRVSAGGAQEHYGVLPDLTVLGKVLGGGLPIGAYAGRRDLMEMVAPAGDVYQAGTLSGNPLATAAGLATLELLDRPAYGQLRDYTDRLTAGLDELVRRTGPPASVSKSVGLLTVFFSGEPSISNYRQSSQCDQEVYGKFCRGLLDQGVYVPPSQFEAWFPSLAHGEAELEHTLSAVERVLDTL